MSQVAPPPAAPLHPVAAPKVDRAALDRGLRLLDEANLDLYRGGASPIKTRSTLEEAERSLDEALRIDSGSGAAFLGRGEVRSRLNRSDAALAGPTVKLTVVVAWLLPALAVRVATPAVVGAVNVAVTTPLVLVVALE